MLTPLQWIKKVASCDWPMNADVMSLNSFAIKWSAWRHIDRWLLGEETMRQVLVWLRTTSIEYKLSERRRTGRPEKS